MECRSCIVLSRLRMRPHGTTARRKGAIDHALFDQPRRQVLCITVVVSLRYLEAHLNHLTRIGRRNLASEQTRQDVHRPVPSSHSTNCTAFGAFICAVVTWATDSRSLQWQW